jgi:DNA-directed RNA polymerase-5 subunit 1
LGAFVVWQVSRHSSFQESRCFYVVLKDGQREDFSYRKCMENFVRKKYPDIAESFVGKYFRKPRGRGDQTATPAGDQTATPAGDQTATPAGDQTATPAGDQIATPAGDQTATPAGDQVAAPAGDQVATPMLADTNEWK